MHRKRLRRPPIQRLGKECHRSKAKKLRNVERAGSLALHAEQETSPFGLMRQTLLVRTKMDRDWLGADVPDKRDVFPLILADHVVCSQTVNCR
jgi:hypothetical protein